MACRDVQAPSAEATDDSQGTALIRIEDQDLVHLVRQVKHYALKVNGAYQSQGDTGWLLSPSVRVSLMSGILGLRA